MGRNLSFRTKIFCSVLLVTLASLLLPLVYAHVILQGDLLREARFQALREARLAGQLLDALPAQAPWQQYLESMGDPSWRLSLISPQGRVLADSSLSLPQLTQLDNHADRPEFREAMSTGEGVSTRYSNTLNSQTVYAAVKLRNGDILRAAVPFAGLKSRINNTLTHLSGVAVAAALLSLLLALLLSYWLKSELAQMVSMVEAISLGKYHRRLRRLPGREFVPLADAVNRMAENIEEQLQTVADQKEQLESILDTMNDGVLVLGPRGRIRRCNRALAQVFPAADAAEGAQVVEVIPVPALQKAVEDMLQTPAEGSSPANSVRLQLEMPPGRFFAVHLGRARAETPTLGAVAVFHDITDLVRLERVRRDFVANVSHELRTPLTAIQGYAETLVSLDDAPGDCRRFGEIIRKHGVYLARMVEELLTLASLENEQTVVALAPMPAQDAYAGAVPLCRSLLDGKNLHLETSVPENMFVMGSATHLAQVFRNLLENACRHAPEGSRIRIEAEQHAGEALFRVCDDGPGIPAADLGRIFERFYRVEKHRNSGSTGLGLAICKHIVERHGGRIWAESPAACCATALCFTLPLLPAVESRQ